MLVDDCYLFRVFRLWWAELMGSNCGIQPDDRMDEWLKSEDLYDVVDFSDVIFRVQKDFGVQITTTEFNKHFGADCDSHETWERLYAHQFTFGRFVDLIASRTPDLDKIPRAYIPVSFAPVSFAGKKCAPAGAFLGMQALAANIDPTVRSFGPSSRISKVLKGTSRARFWRSMQVQIGDAIPPLHPYSQCWWVRLAFVLWFVVGDVFGSVVIASFLMPLDSPVPVITLLSIVHGTIIIIAAVIVDDTYGGLVPDQVETFRDLAHGIANVKTHS